MIVEIQCKTNLDLHREQWPRFLSWLPRVGDTIESGTKHGHFVLRLKVIAITFACIGKDKWIPVVELHDHWPEPRSITDFYKWYCPLVGDSVSSYI